MASKQLTHVVKLNNLKDRIRAIYGADISLLGNIRDEYIDWFIELQNKKVLAKYGFLTTDLVILDQQNNGGIINSNRFYEVKDLLEKEIDMRLDFVNTRESVFLETDKIEVIIDSFKGIYIKSKDRKYPIETGSQRKKILHTLLANGDSHIATSLEDFRNALNNKNIKSSFLSKEIRHINELFKTNLDMEADLILKVSTGGYALNQKTYSFITN